jgi:hypothetical protein
MKPKLRLFAIHQTTTNLQQNDNLNSRTKWYPILDESSQMKSAYFKGNGLINISLSISGNYIQTYHKDIIMQVQNIVRCTFVDESTPDKTLHLQNSVFMLL